MKRILKIFNLRFKETDPSFKKQFLFLETFYKVIALNHFSSDWNKKMSQKIACYISVIIVFCTPVFTMLFLRNTDDVDDIMTCLITFVTSYQVIAKILLILIKSKEINNYCQIVVEKTSCNHKSSRELEIALDYHTFAGRILKLVLNIYSSAWLMFNLYPFFAPKDWALPVTYEIPGIKHTSHPGYDITYVYVVFQTIQAITLIYGFDGTVVLLSVYVAYRLELCRYYFEKIGDFTTEYNTESKQHSLIRKCAVLHTDLFEFMKNVAELYRDTILAQVTSTTGLICICLLHIRIVCILYLCNESILILFSFIYIQNIYSSSYMMFIASIVQVFLYCFCGELIVTKADELTKSIYGCQWYNIKSISQRKMILFMLKNSQIPLGFSAGGFYRLSMELFTRVSCN